MVHVAWALVGSRGNPEKTAPQSRSDNHEPCKSLEVWMREQGSQRGSGDGGYRRRAPTCILGGLPVRKKWSTRTRLSFPSCPSSQRLWHHPGLVQLLAYPSSCLPQPSSARRCRRRPRPRGARGEKVYYKNCTKKLYLTAWFWAGSHLDGVVAGLTRQRGPHAATADSVRGSSFAAIRAVGWSTPDLTGS